MSRRRTALLWISSAAIAALLIAGWIYRQPLLDLWTGWAGDAGNGGLGRPPPLVETAPAERTSIEGRIRATGTLKAPERVTVTAQTAGRIAAIDFEEGDAVARDQVLAVLERERAQASVEEAAAQVERRARDLQRLRDLSERDFVAESEIDRAEAAAEQAEAQLRIATEELANRVIEAPFAGVTGRRLISVGAFVQPGAEVTTLVRNQPLDLLFDVPGVDAGRVERAQRVTATTPAYPQRTFQGTVTFVGTLVDEATRTLPVEATFDNDDGLLRPGMYLQAELVTGERHVVQVPEEAIVTRGPRTLVYVVTDAHDGGRDATRGAPAEESGNAKPPQAAPSGPGRREQDALIVRRKSVQTGARREGWVAITAGLDGGERVVVRGLQGLRDGMTVRTGGGPPAGVAADDGGPPAAGPPGDDASTSSGPNAGDSSVSDRSDTQPANSTGGAER